MEENTQDLKMLDAKNTPLEDSFESLIKNSKSTVTLTPTEKELSSINPEGDALERIGKYNLGRDGGHTGTVDSLDEHALFEEDINSTRARNQSEVVKLFKTIGGGLAEGLLIASEQLGYVPDINTYTNMFDKAHDFSGNWWTSLMKEAEEGLRESNMFKVYEETPDDNSISSQIFKWSALESAISSGVGFGMTGLAAAKAVSVLGSLGKFQELAELTDIALGNVRAQKAISTATGTAAKYVAGQKAMLGAKGATKAFMGPLATSTMANFYMGEMMATDTYRATLLSLQPKIDSGEMTLRQAQELANKRAHSVVSLNEALVLTGYLKFSKIFKQRNRFQSILKNPSAMSELKDIVVKGSFTGFTENVYQEMIQMEQTHNSLKEANIKDEYSDNFADRMANFALSNRALTAGVLGVIGGPIQFAVIQLPLTRGAMRESKNIYGKQQSSIKYFEKLKKDNFEDFKKYEDEINNGIVKGDIATAKLVEDLSIAKEVSKSIENGTIDFIKNDIEKIRDLEESEAEGLNYDKEYKDTANKILEHITNAEAYSYKFLGKEAGVILVHNSLVTEIVNLHKAKEVEAKNKLKTKIFKDLQDSIPTEDLTIYTFDDDFRIVRNAKRFENVPAKEQIEIKKGESFINAKIDAVLDEHPDYDDYLILGGKIEGYTKLLSKLHKEKRDILSEKGQADAKKVRENMAVTKAEEIAVVNKKEADIAKDEKVKTIPFSQIKNAVPKPSAAKQQELNDNFSSLLKKGVKSLVKKNTFTSVDAQKNRKEYTPKEIRASYDGRFFKVIKQAPYGMPIIKEVDKNYKEIKGAFASILTDNNFFRPEALQFVDNVFYGKSSWAKYPDVLTKLEPNDARSQATRFNKALNSTFISVRNVQYVSNTAEVLIENSKYPGYNFDAINTVFTGEYPVELRINDTRGKGNIVIDVYREGESTPITFLSPYYNLLNEELLKEIRANGPVKGVVTGHFTNADNFIKILNADGTIKKHDISELNSLPKEFLFNDTVYIARSSEDKNGVVQSVILSLDGKEVYIDGYLPTKDNAGNDIKVEVKFPKGAYGHTYFLMRPLSGVGIIPVKLDATQLINIQSKEGLGNRAEDIIKYVGDIITKLLPDATTRVGELSEELINEARLSNTSEDLTVGQNLNRLISLKLMDSVLENWNEELQENVYNIVQLSFGPAVMLKDGEYVPVKIPGKRAIAKKANHFQFLMQVDSAGNLVPGVSVYNPDNPAKLLYYNITDNREEMIAAVGSKYATVSIESLQGAASSKEKEQLIKNAGFVTDINIAKPFAGASIDVYVDNEDITEKAIKLSEAYSREEKAKGNKTLQAITKQDKEEFIQVLKNIINLHPEAKIDLAEYSDKSEADIITSIKKIITLLPLRDLPTVLKNSLDIIENSNTNLEDNIPYNTALEAITVSKEISGNKEIIARIMVALDLIADKVDKGEYILSNGSELHKNLNKENFQIQAENIIFKSGSLVYSILHGFGTVLSKNASKYRIRLKNGAVYQVYPNDIFNASGIYAKYYGAKNEATTATGGTLTLLKAKIEGYKKIIDKLEGKEDNEEESKDSKEVKQVINSTIEDKLLKSFNVVGGVSVENSTSTEFLKYFNTETRRADVIKAVDSMEGEFNYISNKYFFGEEAKKNITLSAPEVAVLKKSLLTGIPFSIKELNTLILAGEAALKEQDTLSDEHKGSVIIALKSLYNLKNFKEKLLEFENKEDTAVVSFNLTSGRTKNIYLPYTGTPPQGKKAYDAIAAKILLGLISREVYKSIIGEIVLNPDSRKALADRVSDNNVNSSNKTPTVLPPIIKKPRADKTKKENKKEENKKGEKQEEPVKNSLFENITEVEGLKQEIISWNLAEKFEKNILQIIKELDSYKIDIETIKKEVQELLQDITKGEIPNEGMPFQMEEVQSEVEQVLSKFAEDLSKRTGTSFKIISSDEALKILGDKVTNTPPAFFDTKTNTAYLIKNKAGLSSAVHEIFTHPFLINIEKSNPELYANLLSEVNKNKEIIDYVNEKYKGNNQKTLEHEYIARAMDLAINNEVFNNRKENKTLISKIKKVFKELSQYLKKLFNLDKVYPYQLNPRITLNQLSQFVLYAKTDIPLVATTNEVNYTLKAVNILNSDKAKQVFAKGAKNGWDLNKMLTELAIPKEQKQLLLDSVADKASSTNTKDVEELFNSNPELVNKVYEVLEFTTPKSQQSSINSEKIEQLKEDIRNLRGNEGVISDNNLPLFKSIIKQIKFLERDLLTNINLTLEEFINVNKLSNSDATYFKRLATIRNNFQELVEDFNKAKKTNFSTTESMTFFDSDFNLQQSIKTETETNNKKTNEYENKLLKDNGFEANKNYTADELNDFVQKHGSKQVKFIWNLIKNVAQKLGVVTRFQLKGKSKIPSNAAGHYFNGQIENKASSFFAPASAARIIVHELVHGVTSYILIAAKENNKKVLSKLTARQLKAVEKLNTLLGELKKDKNFEDTYGTKNSHELLAELTNSNFVEKLKAKNIFEKILSAIFEIFNIPFNTYTESIKILEDLISNPIIDNRYEGNLNENYNLYSQVDQVTPQQKQKAVELYSQYLNTGKKDIDGFKKFVNQANNSQILEKPNVILPIGTSGSGKSTFIKSLPQENLIVIEPDTMRVEFTGDINNKSKDREIYEEAAKRAVTAIKQGKQVVFDTTNLTKEKRLPFIEAIKKEIPNANIQYKLMELNPELAKQRIKADIEKLKLQKQNIFTVNPIQGVDKKAIIKASLSNKYIGFGEGISGSSTEHYRKQVGKYANVGNYNSKDVIFVSIGGKRGNPELRKVQQDRTIKEALKAIEQGATLITDNKSYVDSSTYNEGEKRLALNLKHKGYNYTEQTIDGQVVGIWRKNSGRADVSDATIDRHAESYKQMLEDIKNEPISEFNPILQQKQPVSPGNLATILQQKENSTDVENSEKMSFDEVEKLSNMIMNKLLTKEGNFYKKKIFTRKEDFFYNSNENIIYNTEKEIIRDIFKYYEKYETVKNSSDSDIVKYLKEQIENLKDIRELKNDLKETELDSIYAERRLIQSFSKKNKDSLKEYSEDQQNIIKLYFTNLWGNNKYKSEKQAFYHQSQLALKKVNHKLQYKLKDKGFLGILSIIKKLETTISFIENIPTWRELLEAKIQNETQRRLKYKEENLQKNPELQKTISFRKIFNEASYMTQEFGFERKFKFLTAYKLKIKQIFKDYDSSKEIMSSTNTVEVLTNIANNSDSKYKELAASLIPFAKKNNVEIVVLNKVKSEIAGRYTAKLGGLENSKGEYVAGFVRGQIITVMGAEKRFAINPEQLILHEIVHSLSTILIASEGEKTHGKDIFNKYLQYIQQETRKLRDISGRDFTMSHPYGFTDTREMFSEVMTNLEFRDMLRLIPPMNNKMYSNLLEEFLDSVKEFLVNLFKSKENYANALEQLEDLIYTALEIQSNFPLDLEAVLKSLEKDISTYSLKKYVYNKKGKFSLETSEDTKEKIKSFLSSEDKEQVNKLEKSGIIDFKCN